MSKQPNPDKVFKHIQELYRKKKELTVVLKFVMLKELMMKSLII